MSRSVLLFGTFLIVMCCVEACFISKCQFGKRKRDGVGLFAKHKCPACGVGGECYGPDICCDGSECVIGDSAMTKNCRRESFRESPCANSGIRCNAIPMGTCAAEKHCCSSDGCVVDDSCSNTMELPLK